MTISGKKATIVIVDDLGEGAELTEFQIESAKIWLEKDLSIDKNAIAICGAGVCTLIARLVKVIEEDEVAIIKANEKMTDFSFSGNMTSESTDKLRQYLADLHPIYDKKEDQSNKSYTKFLPKPYNFKRRR